MKVDFLFKDEKTAKLEISVSPLPFIIEDVNGRFYRKTKNFEDVPVYVESDKFFIDHDLKQGAK